MTDTQHQLMIGAIKSAVSSATGIVISLPIVDPATFSITSFGGWKHMLLVIAIVTLIGEARFWNQWATSNEPLQTKLANRLEEAQSATKEAVVATKAAESAVSEAKSVAPPKP